MILFNTFITFDGNIFKHLQIFMGDNASPFIADLYSSWCDYWYMNKIVKNDYILAIFYRTIHGRWLMLTQNFINSWDVRTRNYNKIRFHLFDSLTTECINVVEAFAKYCCDLFYFSTYDVSTYDALRLKWNIPLVIIDMPTNMFISNWMFVCIHIYIKAKLIVSCGIMAQLKNGKQYGFAEL